MHDIRIAIALVALVCVAVFSLTYRLLKPRSKPFLDFSAVLIVVLMVAYGCFIFGELWIVKWIPLPSVIVLANWFPGFIAALSAVVWLRLEPASVQRRLPVMLLLGCAAVYAVFYFIPSRPPECRDEWAQPIPPNVWPICLQTTPYTCSAAASATILRTLDIETTEQEMAQLCLTRSGTTWLGLYHGLSTMLIDKRYHVEFFSTDSSGLSEMIADGPVLLCCKLEPSISILAPEYARDGGWIPGAAHSAVYFGRIGDRHIIGDPSQGQETWSTRDLNSLWTGTGLRVVRNEPPGR